MAKEIEMYETVCKDRFDELVAGQREVIGLLRGHNGDPGLLDDMRAIKKGHKIVLGAGTFIVCAVLAQFIESSWGWLTRLF